MKFLPAPWRWDFISTMNTKAKPCIFCAAEKLPDEKSLVIFRGKKFFIILNKYPYNSGHIMIAPYEHLKSPDQLKPGDLLEMMELQNKSLKILNESFHPEGFNIGMNIGKVAGAGIKDHFHLHIVPRWGGDSNFMAVTSETKVLSYDMTSVFKILSEAYQK